MSATADEHIARCARARQEAALLDATGAALCGWAIVARFYAALHLTQAYFVAKAFVPLPDTHDARRKAIRHRSPELNRRFQDAYFGLQDLSESVRYSPAYVAGQANVLDAEAKLAIVESFLRGKLVSLGHKVP